MSALERRKYRRPGWILLILWGLLIISGIVAKRVFGLPDWMVFFHLPAAVCLVMAFHRLSAEFREKYKKQLVARKERIFRA